MKVHGTSWPRLLSFFEYLYSMYRCERAKSGNFSEIKLNNFWTSKGRALKIYTKEALVFHHIFASKNFRLFRFFLPPQIFAVLTTFYSTVKGCLWYRLLLRDCRLICKNKKMGVFWFITSMVNLVLKISVFLKFLG